MAGETLETAAQLLAGYPDNTQGLIQPVNDRNNVISASSDVAYMREDFSPPVVVSPTTNTVDTILNTFFTVAASEAFRFWDKDANGRLFPDYGTITVPAGTFRITAVNFRALMTRQAATTPATFGGNYGYLWGDGAPGTGDIDANSNLTEHRINYTDDDGNDLTAQWQSLRPGDLLNIAGILYKVISTVANAADLTVVHGSLERQAVSGGSTYFAQGLTDDKHDYRYQYYTDGVADGGGIVYAIGPDPAVIGLSTPRILDYSTVPLLDSRIAKIDPVAPDLEMHVLIAEVEGTLI